ncbi:hypothetical protein MHUMG1_09478 [Metarhizium humberi]|uniref:Uncharacterized protein n=1 Tax=Metarhizium humberi TaxID=2596975 RepID=A0A9P8S447_9HYPO|nr:hypothetical protein MHUMG1_09478 [Metarhizium humberi]
MISRLASDTNNATGAGPIDDAAKNKAIEIVLEQYPEFQGPAIPETGQMDKSKTPQAGAKDSHACKRKRRPAFAQCSDPAPAPLSL